MSTIFFFYHVQAGLLKVELKQVDQIKFIIELIKF